MEIIRDTRVYRLIDDNGIELDFSSSYQNLKAIQSIIEKDRKNREDNNLPIARYFSYGGKVYAETPMHKAILTGYIKSGKLAY